MSDRAALVAAVAASPDDDLPKLVFADWLDENGEPERAEFVRLSVAYYREAVAFPPTPDPAKLRRIEELFRTHHQAWLRPVYDAFAQPLPALPDAPSRPVRLGFREANDEQWSIHRDGGITVTHQSRGPIPSLGVSGGLVGRLTVDPDRLSATAPIAAAYAVEPLGGLSVRLPADVAAWERFAGPHLRRVHALSPAFDRVAGDFRPLAEAVCTCEHLGGVREMTVHPELVGFPAARGSVLFDTLRLSPLRRQLTALNLYDLPGVGQLLCTPDHGFDALCELAVSVRGQPGGADALYAGGIADWFRERLTRLMIETTRTHALAWLTAGRPWERLGTLSLTGTGVGDGGAARLAGADTLPAVRRLGLHRLDISDTGATALARSPLVGRLHALFLDGNRIGDAGARELAGCLDRGLGYLSLHYLQSPVSAATRQALTAQYSPRIAFT